MRSYTVTADAIDFLRKKAEQFGVALPPLGKTPRRWPKFLQSPTGEPAPLAGDPKAFALQVVKNARGILLAQMLILSFSYVLAALLPWGIGKMIDSMIQTGFSRTTWTWVAAFIAMTAVMSVADGLNQLAEVGTWRKGALDTSRPVAYRVTRAGREAKRDKPAGDIVTSILNDSEHIGSAMLWFGELTAATVSTLVALGLMFHSSVPLATIVTIGLPVSILLVAILAKPLQAKQAVQREEQGMLTTISTDAVSGLRVLRGIGGEDFYNQRYRSQSARVKAAGIKVGHNFALLAVFRIMIPLLLIAVVVGYGAYLTWQGRMSPGELVAFYGYTAYMRRPIATAANVVTTATRAWVGVKKMASFYALEPAVSDAQISEKVADAQVPGGVKIDFATATLEDAQTGVAIRPHQLTCLVCAKPEVSASLAQRLGRVDDHHQVLADEVDLRQVPLAQVRRGIFLSEAEAQLFSGTLHAALEGESAELPHSRGVTEQIYAERIEESIRQEGALFRPETIPDDPRLGEAIRIADARDAVESLPGGLGGRLSEKARNLSGGQRQRVALARAIYQDAPVLVAIEPTSAVDSHTEARIAKNVAEARRGKTTVIVSASPLWLEWGDEIVVLGEDGREIVRGTHADLKRRAKAGEAGALAYTRIVAREAGGDSRPSALGCPDRNSLYDNRERTGE